MGQYWKLVNIDRKEELHNDGGLKLWEMLMNGCLEQLVNLIRKPNWIPISAGTKAHLLLAKSKSTTSTLLALPQEVLDMIVQELCRDSPESVIYLSLTCVYFFLLLGPEFQRVLAHDNAPWAGDRLIIVGDYADGLDLGGICTRDELRQFDEDEKDYGDNPLYRMDKSEMSTRERLTKVRRRWGAAGDIRRPGELEQRVKEKLMFNGLPWIFGRLPLGLALFNRLAGLARRPQLTTDSDYHGQHAAVLRNLTANQYVRDEAIAESDYAYSLGEIVAIFTTWTNDGSGLVGLDGQGLCAGDRFDITTMADVSGNGLTDVSKLALENLKKATGRKKKDGKRAYDTIFKEPVSDSGDDDSA